MTADPYPALPASYPLPETAPCAGVRSLSRPAHIAPRADFTISRTRLSGLNRVCRTCQAAYREARAARAHRAELRAARRSARPRVAPAPVPVAASPVAAPPAPASCPGCDYLSGLLADALRERAALLRS